jgi:hypothetical protein
MTQIVNIGECLLRYRSYGRNSWFHGVPVSLRDELLTYMKNQGIKVKLRYRGPRAHRHYRSPITRASTCLMADATSFAVYIE